MKTIQDLVLVMKKLLAPGGCPWDREQTHRTLAPFAIEEAFELAEAIENDDTEAMKEELGDYLLQVVFHAQLAEKEKKFTLEDIIQGICEKLVRRHPHVFADTQVNNSGEVLKNWDKIKSEEKLKKGKKEEIFNIPKALPALQRAQKIGDKTKSLKFDWSKPAEVFEKVEEEIGELKAAFLQNDKKATEEELGDVFFVLAQFARHLKLEAETIARQGNKKFEKRFEKLLARAKEKNLEFSTLSTEEKENLWQEIKK